MLRFACASVIAVSLPAGLLAQDQNDSASASEGDPIIVVGEVADPDEPEARVIVGSRIPRKPIYTDGPIATSTGTPGLTPGSGMDPAGRYTRKITKRDCVADRAGIGKPAACALSKAIAAKDAGDTDLASAILRGMTAPSEFSAVERLAAAQLSYDVGKQAGDMHAQEDALLLMLDTGVMNAADQGMATRGLVSHALADGRRQLAHTRLLRLDQMGAATPQELANQAILARELGISGAAEAMQRAIAARKDARQEVPQSWTAFAAATD